MNGELDPFELKILRLLQADTDLSVADLADRVGLSTSPCWRRIDRLQREGYIRGRVALLDRAKLGLNVNIYLSVKLDANGRRHLDQFENAVMRHPEVIECHTVMGRFDYMLRIVTQDIPAYEAFLMRVIGRLAGIAETSSMVTMSEVKSTTALPI